MDGQNWQPQAFHLSNRWSRAGWSLAGLLLPLVSALIVPLPAGPPAAVRAAEPATAPASSGSSPIDYGRDIRPIISKSCFACHGPDAESRKGELRLDKQEFSRGKGASGQIAIVPGKLDESELIARITSTDDNDRMPPPGSGHELNPGQIETLKKWVQQGAQYAEHWSLVKPVKSPLPTVQNAAWPRSALDYFILAELERAGLTPAPEADRYELIRRLSLDLRGLPPTPAEIKQFVNDSAPDAYEQLVDRLLADPAFGERWARMWLDIARYADSAGYGSDPLRMTIWRYRDWVIQALNRNQPFNEFVTEQLAGDLLPNPTLDQLVATAFHRNTMTNTEGGTDDEEFRVAAVRDRVDTTIQAFMGLTMGCAKCHSHKYDPITQQEYYQFFAFFNQTTDNDRPDEEPTVAAPSPEQQQELERINAQIAEVRKVLDAATPELTAAQKEWEQSLGLAAEWTTLKPSAMQATSGAKFEQLEDGRIRVTGELAKTDTYTLRIPADLAGITAFRLESIPDAMFPQGGAGRAPDGNFVLSRFSVTAEPATGAVSLPEARFVRIELPGTAKMLSLAEVQVFRGADNLAIKGKASQSSTDYEGPANLAIDGNTNGHYFEAKSTTHTRQEDNPWWEVELPAAGPVDRIVVWNRTDGNVYTRSNGMKVLLLDAQRQPLWQQTIAEAAPVSQSFSPSGEMPVELTQAAADHSQGNFPVANALQQKDLAASGWAVGPQIAAPHWAIFLVGKPVTEPRPRVLAIKLEHLFPTGQYTLGQFRLSYTKNNQIQKRLGVPATTLAIIDLPADKRTPEQQSQLAAYYRTIAPALQAQRDQLAKLEKSRPQPPNVPVLKELPADQRRVTNIMVKGNFLVKGPEVTPAVPSQLHPLPANVPTNRLGIAQWLFDRQNPLTARVTVNRFWSQLFGIGIVETEEDFGTQGELPSHPALLDWLAVEFMEPGESVTGLRLAGQGVNSAAGVTGTIELKPEAGARPWDLKRLLKKIVLSSTYRQSSQATPLKLEKDPRNRLLARAPRYRLEAEMVRDQALALSGLLSHKLGGPSVYPPQPPNLWQAAFNGQRNWATSAGEDKYRRGLYTFWRRTIPYPSMATFDAPSREICALRRVRTNTPLQAFVTLNDPVYVEAAQALARRIAKEGGSTPAERLKFGLELCLCRPAQPEQLAALHDLYAAELADYRQDLEAAKKLATDPLGPLPEGMLADELAALTVVANVLLNLDSVLSRH